MKVNPKTQTVPLCTVKIFDHFERTMVDRHRRNICEVFCRPTVCKSV